MTFEASSRAGPMAPPPKPASTCLFQVHLRLRPPPVTASQSAPTQQSLYPELKPLSRFLTVEPVLPEVEHGLPTHITLNPPSESRKRAVEKFAFTKVFEEKSSQLDIFIETGAIQLVEGVLAESRDGLLATLGVTGSGKSHTILGSKSERGLTQMSVDLIFRSLKRQVLQPSNCPLLLSSLKVVDAAESDILSASSFLEASYGDIYNERFDSRATTPFMVGDEPSHIPSQTPSSGGLWSQWSILGLGRASDVKVQRTVDANHLVMKDAAVKPLEPPTKNLMMPSQLPFWKSPRITRKKAKLAFGHVIQDNSIISSTPRRHPLQRPSALPTLPDLSSVNISVVSNMECAIVVSMYEVYNDRIFDLLCHAPNGKELRRRPLLFKSTEMSQDRKVVAGLRKIVCGSLEEALMVLETGLIQRRVAGTGSNSVSSRSHGFFCVEVKKRPTGGLANAWTGAQLTIVDLAGSERARNAKTAGATLAEAGKINESLMYLGQCLQMQSDNHDSNKPSIVPFRQCKLTELLFSNSFPSHNHFSHLTHLQNSPHQHHRNPQRGIMIVTADPLGDFNATSQILRYSAMAREITVPRIPSVSSTILAGIDLNHKAKVHPFGGIASGRSSPDAVASAEVEAAHAEMERLAQELEVLGLQLEEERERRLNAEENWQKAETRAEEIEAAVREEVWSAMEAKMELERARWMNALAEQGERYQEHMDQKLEMLSEGVIRVHEDDDVQSQRMRELEDENASLRRRIEALEREVGSSRSPTKTRGQRHAQRSSGPRHLTTSPLEEEEEEEEEERGSPSVGGGEHASDDDLDDALLTQLHDTRLTPQAAPRSSPPPIKVELLLASPAIKIEELASPPKMKPLVPSIGSENGVGGVGKGMAGKSPGKKMRKLTPRTRTLGMGDGEVGLGEGDENLGEGYF